MPVVLDAWALMAYFEDEPAAMQVEQLLDQAEQTHEPLLLSVVNWGEIYYSVTRAVSPAAAEQVARRIAAMPISLVPIADDLILVRQAARYKASYRMSYADAFAAGLARLRNASLATGDQEFRPLEGELQITWLDR